MTGNGGARVNAVMVTLLALLLFMSGLSLLSANHWLAELSSALLVLSLLLNLLAWPALFLYRLRRPGSLKPFGPLLLIVLMALVWRVAPFCIRSTLPATASRTEKDLKVMALRYASADLAAREDLESLWEDFKPDLLAVNVLDHSAAPLQFFVERYRHHILKPLPAGSVLALFANFELTNLDFTFFESTLPPVINVSAELFGQELIIFLLAQPKTFNQGQFYSNSVVLRRVVTYLKHQPQALIFADLAVTPFSRQYNRLLVGGELIDSSYGRGLFLRATCPWPCALVSHLFHKGNLIVRGKRVVRLKSGVGPVQLIEFSLLG